MAPGVASDGVVPWQEDRATEAAMEDRKREGYF